MGSRGRADHLERRDGRGERIGEEAGERAGGGMLIWGVGGYHGPVRWFRSGNFFWSMTGSPAAEWYLAVGETAILLHPPLPLTGVSIGICQQNNSLADGWWYRYFSGPLLPHCIQPSSCIAQGREGFRHQQRHVHTDNNMCTTT